MFAAGMEGLDAPVLRFSLVHICRPVIAVPMALAAN